MCCRKYKNKLIIFLFANNKAYRLLGLTIRLVGKSLVRFTETVTETKQTGKGRKDERKLVVYQNEEEYFNYHLNLIGNGKNDANIAI